MWCCLGSGLSCTTKKYINYYYLLTRIHCWKYFVWPLLKGAGGAKSKLYVISCCRSVRLEIIKVILSNADATTCVCGFQYNTLHGCYNISPPNIDNKNVNPLPPAIDQQSSKHWFLACSMSCFFLFWRCVCPLQCVQRCVSLSITWMSLDCSLTVTRIKKKTCFGLPVSVPDFAAWSQYFMTIYEHVYVV